MLPYIVDEKTLGKATKQPKFLKNLEFTPNLEDETAEWISRGYAREDLLLKTCNGEVKNNFTLEPNQCHYLHNLDPFLKLGPFQLEVHTKTPYRSVFHDFLSQKEIDYLIEISLPHLSRVRYTSDSNSAGQNWEYKRGERKTVIHKTVQHWFNGMIQIIVFIFTSSVKVMNCKTKHLLIHVSILKIIVLAMCNGQFVYQIITR